MKAIEYSFAPRLPFHPPPPPFPAPHFPILHLHPQLHNPFHYHAPPFGVLPPGFENFLELQRRLIESNGGLKWRPQGSDCIVVNCDGSFRPRDKSVGYGAIIRDQNGKVIKVKANYETIEELHGPVVLLTELKAIRDGVQLARRLGFKKLEVQSDSKDAIDILKRSRDRRCPKECSGISREILAERDNFDKLDWYFVYKETNQAADFFSRYKTSDGEKILSPSELPHDLEKIVEDDNNENITYARSKNCRIYYF